MDWITDHAVLRFLERAYGIDIDAVRREIGGVPGLQAAAAIGATSYSQGGLTYRLSPMGKLTTVVPAEGPASGSRGSSQVHGFRTRLRSEPTRSDIARHQRRVARGVIA